MGSLTAEGRGCIHSGLPHASGNSVLAAKRQVPRYMGVQSPTQIRMCLLRTSN